MPFLNAVIKAVPLCAQLTTAGAHTWQSSHFHAHGLPSRLCFSYSVALTMFAAMPCGGQHGMPAPAAPAQRQLCSVQLSGQQPVQRSGHTLLQHPSALVFTCFAPKCTRPCFLGTGHIALLPVQSRAHLPQERALLQLKHFDKAVLQCLQDDAIRNLFSSKTKREYTVSSLVVFVSAFYFLAIVTYGISCPTGLFVPSILCGAAYGRLVSQARTCWPSL